MNEDWRYDDGKMHERALCLTCIVRSGRPINRSVYEFCHYFVSNGLFAGSIPTEEDPLTEKLKGYGGDVFAMASDKLLKEMDRWEEINEQGSFGQESSQENTQEGEEAP